jgi:hypothetical protein
MIDYLSVRRPSLAALVSELKELRDVLDSENRSHEAFLLTTAILELDWLARVEAREEREAETLGPTKRGRA